MTEMRVWTADKARVAVANAMGRKLGRGAVNLDAADEVLAALGISGDVTLVPGRLEQPGAGARCICHSGFRDRVDAGTIPHESSCVYAGLYRVRPPHAGPGQP